MRLRRKQMPKTMNGKREEVSNLGDDLTDASVPKAMLHPSENAAAHTFQPP